MTYSDPKYPIVNPSPSVDDCVKSMRFRDYAVAAGVTASTWGYGYIFGKPVRLPTASTAAALGFTFAGFLVLEDTRGRLMGFKENAREVRLYGAYKEQIMPRPVQDRRYPTAVSVKDLVTPVRPQPTFKNFD
mmetsp:Transcript_15156/g.22187  ORF Transcript_15156/g.22187 Transcript_15156/m.22187 type:complete len:132 (-) Transcript_15156:208-603(-)|eukprot:CAMPEP_0197247360 /NCGR_PEP_ID=MMETSP1429-20130617/29146_1 /TAXON_ID=49237 /ORGANISM="Chaetoceros  sp., Strain UNC1202" /LENGTH=131 /DNA_ID=CAMNT_0042708253 /DNA_START=136 /DNA_END=531 /DNA_ORIENTATION=-